MNKAQSRKERNKRKGHAHSPPVRKLEIVQENMAVSLSLITLTSGPLHGSIHQARAKSPTQGAYAPIFGQGQAKPKGRITPKHRRKFEGGDDVHVLDGVLLVNEPLRKVIVPERAYKMHKNKKGFRPFNPTGKA